MVKLKDIAEACGVSVATVSRALNGITEGKRGNTEHIRQVAQEMGYYSNAAARTLKTNRSNNIGILYEDRMNHEYFSLLIDALRKEAGQKGYDLTFINTENEEGRRNYYDHARRRNLDGVVVIQADFTSSEVIRLATSGMPTVVIDHEYEGCDCVMSDNRLSMTQIVRAAFSRGHRRIACIFGEDSTATRNRRDGFYRSCAETGLRVPNEYMKDARFHDPAACAQAVMELLDCAEPPTCILCPDDYSCIGALGLLEAKGLKVPEDISLIGYDGIRMAQMMHPHLTTYQQDAESIGREAINLLAEAIERPEEHRPHQIHVKGRLLEGETLGNAK